MNTEDSEFERIEREIKTRALPDPIHHTETRESLEYITGWNDCRAAMLAEQPAPVQSLRDTLERPAYTHALALKNLRDALELVLRWVDDWCETGPETGFNLIEEKANAALAKQPAQQEPVAWGIIASNTGRICQVELDADEVEGHNPKHIVPLCHCSQAQRKPLTDDQIHEMANDFEEGYVFLYRSFARAIEAAHGIKEKS